jgi:hypothetical protein
MVQERLPIDTVHLTSSFDDMPVSSVVNMVNIAYRR